MAFPLLVGLPLMVLGAGVGAGAIRGLYGQATKDGNIMSVAYQMLVSSCGSCSLLGNLYAILTYLGAAVFKAITPDLLKVGWLFFGVWMVMQVGKIANPFSSGEQGPRVFQEMFTRCMYLIPILFFLNAPSVSVGAGGTQADPFYDWIVAPIRDAGIDVAVKIMTLAEGNIANGGSFITAAPVPNTPMAKVGASATGGTGNGCGAFQPMAVFANSGVSVGSANQLATFSGDSEAISKLLCIVEKMQNTMAIPVTIGVRMATIDLKSGFFASLGWGTSDFGTQLLSAASGILLIIAYVFLGVRIVYCLIDVIWRWSVAWLIAPFCLFAFAIPQMSSYGIKLIKLIAQAGVMLIILAFGVAVVGVLLSYVPQMLSDPAAGVSLKTLDDVYKAFQAEANKSVVLTVFDSRYIYLIVVAWAGQALVARAAPMSEALVDWRDAGDLGAELYGRTKSTVSSVVGTVSGAAVGAAGAAVTRGAAIKSAFRAK